MDHPKIPYVVKLNSKTDLVKSLQAEPLSKQWVTVDQVAALKNENYLKVLGIGYTVYLGSENEAIMLQEAAQIVHRAHHHGLPTILWMYPRGRWYQPVVIPSHRWSGRRRCLLGFGLREGELSRRSKCQ